MTPAVFDRAALALPAATRDVRWGDRQVYKVGGKMFAVLGDEGVTCSIKVSDIAFEALIETGQARPAPYLARAKWVRFDDVSVLDAGDVKDWLASAHALVVAKLSRKARAELNL